MNVIDIQLTVNGEAVAESVEPRTTLVDFLRETLGLTGSHVGCEHGVCGACTVLLGGTVVRGCLTLAVQCDGANVETIEGISDSGAISDLQEAFRRRNALQQMGKTVLEFTTGMIMTNPDYVLTSLAHSGVVAA